MNTMQCPEGYSCSMYPAWGAGDYVVFLGTIALCFLALIAVVWWLTRR